MVWLKNPTRLIFDTIKNNSSKIKTLQSSNPIQPITNSFSTHSPKPNFSSTKSILFNHSQPIFRNSLLHNFFNQNQSKRSVFGVSKRFYYVDRPKVDHSKPRGYNKDLGNVLLSVVALIGYFAFIPPRNLETVPYTIRTESVLLSYRLGRESGDIQYNLLKDDFKDKILPALHPESIRVQRILQDIVDALQKGLKKGQVWSELDYSPDCFGLDSEKGYGHETVKALSERISGEEEKWGSEEKWAKDEIIDEKWVEKTRKKGQEKRMKSQMAHLEGLKWEVFVVNSPMVNAFCLPGGKIVVFTGLLNHFKTDAEVATIIGHEVGHAVATHSAEQISKNSWLTILQLVLYHFFAIIFLTFPFSQRTEMEADNIGLLLLASAGYDPRMAPQVYEKLGKISPHPYLMVMQYPGTHPSCKERAQTLAQAKVMEEALGIYKELQAGRAKKASLNLD